MAYHLPSDSRKKGLAANNTMSALEYTEHDDPLDWANLLEDIHVSDRAAPKHRRTYSAPPSLAHLHTVGLAGKRSVRSPRQVPTPPSVGVITFDPFGDLNSPVYKKHSGAGDDQLGGVEGVGALAPSKHADGMRARAQSFDASALHLSLKGGEPRSGGGYKCRRCGDANRNHVCTVDGPAADGARDVKTVPWTSSEDKVICDGVALHGFKWSLISTSLPGRTDNAVRNRWHRLEQARRWREDVQAQYQQAAAVDGATAPAAMPGSAYPGYKCRRCGQPKRGHVCPYEDTTQLPAPRPLQAAAPARPAKGAAPAAAHARVADAQRAPLACAPVAASRVEQRGFDSRAHLGVPLHGARAPKAQPSSLHRPLSAPAISVVPPSSTGEMRAALAATALLPTPSPQRYLLEHLGTMPLSAHLRSLESGIDGDVIHVGDLEDLIFGSLPIEMSELTNSSPLRALSAFSPRRFARGGPPALASIPSGDAAEAAKPGLTRQSTPQAISAA